MSAQFKTIQQIQSYLTTVKDPLEEISRQLKLKRDQLGELFLEESRWFLAVALNLTPSDISSKSGLARLLIEYLMDIEKEHRDQLLIHVSPEREVAIRRLFLAIRQESEKMPRRPN